MTKTDVDRFAEVWRKAKIAHDAYGGKKASPERMEMYFDDLKEFDIAHVERAFVCYRREGGGPFPKIKDLRVAIFKTRGPATHGERPAFNPDDPHYCYGCHDTGWTEQWCVGSPAHQDYDPAPHLGRATEACGGEHLGVVVRGAQTWPGHAWVQRCKCFSTNPVLKHLARVGAL